MSVLQEMTFSPVEVITAICAVAMLVLNLTLRAGMTNLKLSFEKDMAGVQLQIANLRAEVAVKQGNLQIELMQAFNSGFLPRGEAEAMHEANTERLKGLQSQIQALAVRVGDIS